jgi:hypothetical protein
MWVSGSPLTFLLLFYLYIAAYILVGAAWVIVALAQLAYYGIRAIVRYFRKDRK